MAVPGLHTSQQLGLHFLRMVGVEVPHGDYTVGVA